MKSASDPRHQKRITVIKELFAETFRKQQKSNDMTKNILNTKETIDEKIKKAAPSWPIDKLNKIDLAVLRLAIYELSQKKVPPKVVIDEAVELSKEFGSENSPSFVNGVLATIYKEYKQENESK